MMEQEKGTEGKEGSEFGLLGDYLKQKRTEKKLLQHFVKSRGNR